MTEAEKNNTLAFLEGKIDGLVRHHNTAGLQILVESLADAASTADGAVLERLARDTEYVLRNAKRKQQLARLGINL